MKIAAIDVGQRYRCPVCAAQEFERETYEVTEEQLKGENPIVYLARRKASTEHTVGLDAVGTKLGLPASGPVTRPSERHSARSPGGTPVGSVAASAPYAKAETTPIPTGQAETALPPVGFTGPGASDLGPGSLSDSRAVLGILPSGARLGGYRILDTLGHGGMGVVYKAHDERLDRAVALKVLSRQLTANRQFVERFYREARAAAGLSHPNITVIYFVGDEDRTYYYAMEFVQGRNLADVSKEKGPLPPARVLDIARQCALGLKAAATQGIIHRDIKPQNLLITADERVKITDFGLAKALVGHALELTSTGVVMGTPIYMSPEQGKGAIVDHRSDIYSLGATAYHLLFGKPPFEADSPIALILKHLNEPLVFPDAPRVPEEVKALVRRMLEKDPDRRAANYDELIADIDRALRGEREAPPAPPQKLVVLRHRRDRSTAKRSLFKAGKLSVARTNLKLGRREKAVTFLQEALAEAGDPELKSEAALLLLDIYEKDGDQAQAQRMAELIAEHGKDPIAIAYASWKLALLDEKAALGHDKSALARYERILKDPPEGMPRPLIEAQLRRLRSRIESSERDVGTTQVVLGEDESS